MPTLAQLMAAFQDPDVDGPLIHKAPRGRMDDAYAPWIGVYRPPVDGIPVSDGVYRQNPATILELLQKWQAQQAGIRLGLPEA